jgi:hypothetical protein
MAGKRGQVSQEMIFALGIIIIFFTAMLFYYYDKRDEAREAEEFMEKRHDCFMLSAGITGVYVNKGTLNITLSYDAEIRGSLQLIRVDDYPCALPINAVSDVNLTKGDIVIQNQGNEVVVNNA